MIEGSSTYVATANFDRTIMANPNISWGAKGLYLFIYGRSTPAKARNIYTASKEDRETVLGYVEELLATGHLG
jgi:hypothetical protein